MAKILLISIYDKNYLGIRFLSSYLLENGHKPYMLNLKDFPIRKKVLSKEVYNGHQISRTDGLVHLYDPVDSLITEKEYALLKEHIDSINPDIIGLSTRSTNNNIVPPIISFIKNAAPNTLFIAGGFGPTLDSEYYLNCGIDLVVKADGEEALLEIANAIDKNTYSSISDKIDSLKDIANSSFMKDGKAVHNAVRPQEKDLGKFPAPLYGDEYYAYIENNSLYTNETITYTYKTLIGRGCIGTCTYCSGGQWFKQYSEVGHVATKRRNRPLNDVFQELKSIDKTKHYSVTFWDELFIAPTKELIAFFERYKKEINLPFFLYVSYEQFLANHILFEKAIEAGWATTCIGIQTGSEKLAREIYGRKNKNSTYIDYAWKLFDNNILTEYHLIGGNCYETEEDFQATLDLIKALPFDYTNIRHAYILHPKLTLLPKTPITELAPKLLTEPMTAHAWLYRAALIHLRRIMNDKDFEEVRTIEYYKENPDLLLALYRSLLQKMQVEEINRLIKEYKGKNILFYGAGDIFKNMRKKFKESNILGVLLDEAFIKDDCKEIEEVPVIEASEVQNMDKDSPIFACSRDSATTLKRNLIRKYGIDKSRVHTITIMYPSYY